MANDKFADIAANGIGGRTHLLKEQKPEKHERRECVPEKISVESLVVKKKSYTREKLAEELKTERKKMEQYFLNYAPKPTQYNKRKNIDTFILNGTESVKIPHYGGPTGNATDTYEADVEITKKEGKEYYICFKGADYYAVVYINGKCVGTHEGFFSPFEFRITDAVKNKINKVKIELYNDYIYMGNGEGTEEKEGNKLYAATGPGWDDAAIGWHHCPPGMGLYNKVYIEERAVIHITDIFVRPIIAENTAEIWVEVNNESYETKNICLKYSVYGRNFREIVCENTEYIPQTTKTVGMGDSLTEAEMGDRLGKGMSMPLKNGKNIYKISVKIEDQKLWDPETPYLYEAQVSVISDEKETDVQCCDFGMRSFVQDTRSEKKGMFYLNGKKIRLRGANTMGFEQQDVMRGDFNQLIDDILLAKLCNMNFLRFTQRPVQDEVYEYCDMLGLMTQTDLPLFGCMRRTKLCEGVRQAEEMEHFIRKHPCNIVISYINEPFPNANNEPHRHLLRSELEDFFKMCDIAVKMQNPDRVIKHVDGDYDPPTDSMPDNHCYPMWYNGHGIDVGKLHKGYWLPVKPYWYYGCGEYGTEGLDFCDVMRECYPKEWIKEPFDPSNIIKAQTGNFHRFFYDSQNTMENWVKESQEYQRFATKFMTEAFRRNNNMVSQAIHLFIDAWPSGWMKTIMDCRRNPKPAYFAYRDALEPIMLSLRTDRFTYFAGEKINIECYICNDTNISGNGYKIVYEIYRKEQLWLRGTTEAKLSDCESGYSSECVFAVNNVNGREKIKVRAILVDKNGESICENNIDADIFEDVVIPENNNIVMVNPEVGTHMIAGEKVFVKKCGMLPVHFVSRKTGHKCVEEFGPKDFSYWYDKKEDMITPIADKTFTVKNFTPILLSSNRNESGEWQQELVCAEKEYKGKRYIICTVDLRTENPVAKIFLKKLMNE